MNRIGAPLILLCLLAFGAAGCAPVFGVKFVKNRYVDSASVRRVGVLPFEAPPRRREERRD